MAEFFSKLKKQIFLSSVEVSRRRLSFAFYALTIIFYELVMQIYAFGEITWKFIFPIIFSIPFALFVIFITNLFGKRVNMIISWAFLAFLFLFYSTQVVYSFVFKSLLSITAVGMGGDAVTNFYAEIFHAIKVRWFMFAIFLVPLVCFGILTKKKILSVRSTSRRFKLSSVIAYVLVHFITVGSLFVGGVGPASAFGVYFSDDADTDISARNLGLVTTARLELKNMIFGKESTGVDLDYVDLNQFVSSVPESEPDAPFIDTSPNVIKGIDFASLNDKTSDEDIIKLNNYFAAQSGTNKNEYTGYFKDKNLIVLCAESFSPYFIDREMTPTLYKMVTGGFVFKNYFNSWPNTTTNGEYSLCMGMFPDMSRHKSDGSFKLSAKNYLPYCFGNQFKNIGVNTYAYHNYKSSYYTRKESHPNMGYDVFKTMGNGMKFTTAWPASDLEMMEQSVDDYINEERFHAYYMTFSGHYRYAFDSNPMCARNRSKVKNLKYSNAVKAYISCNLELEYALSYLFERLEEAEKLDDTVIVLASDHYPYGLTSKEYNELAGEEIDTTFGKFRSSFICYNSAMDPIEVETPCCNIDILPTMLNLFGLEYDSRLITGTDVFSNGNHVAILSNKSFITDKVMYDAEKGKTTYLVNENEVPEGYIEALSQVVTNKMSIATTVLNKDYYRFVYENTIGIK